MEKIRKSNHFVNLNLNVRGLNQSATLVINERSNQLIQQGKTVYKLGLGQSPFPVPKLVQEALKRNAHQKDYLPVKGLMKLREAIAAFNIHSSVGVLWRTDNSHAKLGFVFSAGKNCRPACYLGAHIRSK